MHFSTSEDAALEQTHRSAHPHNASAHRGNLGVDAKWIGLHTLEGERNVTFLTKKRFIHAGESLGIPPLSVAADSRYVIYLNGTRIGAGPARSSRKRCFADSWEVAHLLRRGENILVAEVHSPMVSTFTSDSLYPAVWVKWEGILASGEDWEIVRDPSRRSEGKLYTFQLGYSEWRDMRKLPPDWAANGGNTLAWQPAKILSENEGLRGKALVTRDIPPLHEQWIDNWHLISTTNVVQMQSSDAVREELDFAAIIQQEIHFDSTFPQVKLGDEGFTITPSSQPRGAVCIVDFGEVILGNIEIELEGPSGVVVDFAYAEALDGGRVHPKRFTYSMADRIVHGGGRRVIDLSLHDRGWRYLQIVIRCFEEVVTIHRLRARDRRFPVVAKASFQSSDAWLNRLWKMCDSTLSACAVDTIIDCPWREQALWLNDLLVVSNLYLRWSGDARILHHSWRLGFDGQREDGLIGAVPPFDGEYFFTLPAIAAISLWDIYLATANITIVEEMMPSLLRALENYRRWRGEDGLIDEQPLIPHFVDWGYHSDHFVPGGKSAILNFIAAAGMQSAGKLLKAMGEQALSRQWQEESAHLAQCVEDRFWDAERRCFIDSWTPHAGPRSGSQHTHAVGLYFDLISPAKREAAMAALLSPSLVQSEFYYQYFVLLALCRNGLAGKALEKIRELWGPMVAEGSSTVWEMREGIHAMSGSGSLCHAFSCAPLAIMQEVALGISLIEPGYQKFRFSPNPVALTSCRGSVPTPRGMIHVGWTATGDQIRIDLDVPAGSTALLPDGTLLTEGRHDLICDHSFTTFQAVTSAYRPPFAGLAPDALWIASPLSGGPRSTAPSPYFRKHFYLPATPQKGVLRIATLGLYECEINGKAVSKDTLVPGWTDFSKTAYVYEYDVTSLLAAGENAIGVVLGDGWYCGFLAWYDRQFYGDRPRFKASLEITNEAGQRQVIISDQTWKTTTGPILESDLLMGEAYDARKELDGWSYPQFVDTGWGECLILPPKVEPELLERGALPPVRRIEELPPLSKTVLDVWTGPVLQIDFGQNFAGRVRIAVRCEAGRTIRIQHGEMLDEHGRLYTANLRTARAEDSYVTRGEGEEVWEPRFTYHGFRYVEITGLRPGESMEVTGVVLHSALKMTGRFSCSNPLLNQLQSNILWSQKSNFVEVPTDCPQRDERLGWTGDAQIFARTAAFNMDVREFFKKWMRDVRDGQTKSGGIPCVIPTLEIDKIFDEDGGPGWSDAVVICPWTIYLCYGDLEILRDNYPLMQRYIAFLVRHRSVGFVRSHPDLTSWQGYGDWLAQDDSGDDKGATPKDLIGTAFLAYALQTVIKIATLLDDSASQSLYVGWLEETKRAYRARFLNARGFPLASTQTAFVLTLAFDLAPEEARSETVEALCEMIAHGDYGLRTGFIGTPYLLHVLDRYGKTEIAYRLLENEAFPSWLYPIANGATTIWERLDAYTVEKGFQSTTMNSFNHYAYGAVGAWLYQAVAGIDLDEHHPGYERVIFRPRPGGSLQWAQASLDTPRGRAEIQWKLKEDVLEIDLLVPEGSCGRFDAPERYCGEWPEELSPGRHQFVLQCREATHANVS